MIRALLCIATALAIALTTIGSTGANFTAVQQNTGNSYNAKPDWIAPTVSLADPGANLRATVPLSATANDSGSGVATVVIERSPAGAGTWAQVCSASVSPYSCNLDTTAGATPDGLYDFRATATDVAGNSATSATVASRRIDNTVPAGVTLTDPGTNLAGTKSESGAATDTGGSGIATWRLQYKPSAGSTWVDGCSATSSPYSCSFNTNTASTPDGLYDFRSAATDAAGNTTFSTAATSRRIDNTAPAGVTMTDPGASFSGTKAFTGAATDTGGSGVASVKFQYRPSSGGLWLDGCTDPSSPYGCSMDTTTITDGLYDWQALATDNAGNTTASTVFTSRRVDNLPPTVTMNDPGQFLKTGSTLSASAADGGGIASVVIQRRTNGGTTWTTICTINASPYTCALSAATDGLYDFQAIATDNAAKTTTSTPVLARRIDNTNPTSATITNPGASLSGTATIAGGGADAGSGVGSVTIQYSPTGAGTWSTACVDTTSPYSCGFDTTTVTDGLYDFRSLVTDNSGNTLASATASPNSRIDNTPPTVTMTDPGAYLHATATVGATASDGGGIASVRIEYSVAGANSWTAACTDTTSPYTCPVTTTSLTNGGFYDFRAIATDNAGRTATSAVVAGRQVDNSNPSGTMNDPGAVLTGTVTFTGTATDPTPGSGVASVDYQYLYLGFIWTTACTATTAPWSCTTDTSSVPDGSYTWRTQVTDRAGNTATSATIASRRVDNNAPTVTMSDPGGLNGVETLSATAADGQGAGVTSVRIQYKLTAGSTWADVCTDTITPYSCTFDTSGFAEGTHYDFRAIALDGAGFSTTSTVVSDRVVDRTPPTVTLTDPGTLRGTETLASNPADSGSGVASVLYEYKTSAGSTWLTACSASATPWSCTWSAAALTEGTSYDVRVTATDAAGLQSTSTITGRVADNDTTPTGTTINATNGGATAGKMESGDVMTFTFSEPVAPSSVLSGWAGSSTAVSIHVDDFTTGSLDRVSIWNSGNTTRANLTSDPATGGGLQTAGNYVPTGGARFAGTMVQSGSTVTVTFGALSSGSVNATVVGKVDLLWFPSSSALDLAGNPFGTTSVTEGGNDSDF